MSDANGTESVQLKPRPRSAATKVAARRKLRPTRDSLEPKSVRNEPEYDAQRSRSPAKPERKPVDWALIWQRIKYYAAVIAIRTLMLMIYLTVIREGMVSLFDVFATKLHRLPLLGWMANDALTYDLDLAFVAAIGVFSAVCFSSAHAVRLLVIGDDHDLLGGNDELSNRREFLTIGLAVGLMLVDIVLLYLSVAESDWGGGGFSFKASVVSVLYAFVLVGMTLMMLQLKSVLIAFERKRGIRP